MYRHARVVSHVTNDGRVAIEADVPRRVLDRVKAAGGHERSQGFSLSLLVVTVAAACGRTVAPPVVTTPRYPDYIVPTLPEADPRLADIVKSHDTAWNWFQAGDLSRAETEFQAVLKRSPQFYPSETALGYVALARGNEAPRAGAFRSRAPNQRTTMCRDGGPGRSAARGLAREPRRLRHSNRH